LAYFSPLWYVEQRKIWQPWWAVVLLNSGGNTPLKKWADLHILNRVAGVDKTFTTYIHFVAIQHATSS
jgi:hypothetical protein